MAKARLRLQYMFWLDVNKPEENALAETIAELKENKTFSRVVREGIRLMVDLWRGNLIVLLALFPWVEDEFFERFKERQPEPDYAMREQLVRLERLLMEQGNQPITTISSPVATTSGGPKPLPAPSFSLPKIEDDDDQDTLIITKNQSSSSSINFVNMLRSLH